jgi:hypothetical protein
VRSPPGGRGHGDVFTFAAADGSPASLHDSAPYEIAIPVERHAGDLDAMVERRAIRVLTVYSKTIFFFDNGTPRGVAYDAMTVFGAGAQP